MQTLKKNILPILLLAVPFMVLSRGVQVQGQHLFFSIIPLIILGVLIQNRWVSFFLFYVSAWQIFIFLYAMIWPEQQRWSTYLIVEYKGVGAMSLLFMMNDYLWIALGAMVFYSASILPVSEEIVFDAICIGSLIQAGLAALQLLGVDLWTSALGLIMPSRSDLGGAAGTMGNGNYLGGWLAISLPFFFRGKWWVFVLPILALLIPVRSATAFAAALAGLLAYGLYSRRFTMEEKIWASVLAVFFVCAFGLIYHPIFHNDRFDMWWQAAREVMASPAKFIFGLGPGNLSAGLIPLHSEWVTCLQAFGYLGLVMMAGYFIFGPVGNLILTSSLAAIGVDMLGNSPLHLGPSAFLILVICGLLERTAKQPKEV